MYYVLLSMQHIINIVKMTMDQLENEMKSPQIQTKFASFILINFVVNSLSHDLLKSCRYDWKN